ncbi:MAG: hypothetical protein A2046_15805 [Bacteroidetes bacterium GWA2_30_7]|nr:MAG: hypothetical protein A2046_15805 [Bacteroidetes bacterium GWA2_30_7]
MKKLLFTLAVVFLATIIIVSSCKKKEEEPDPEPTPSTISISGTVYDEVGAKVADVAITANDKSGTTDANGAFSITGITKPSGKLAVYFKKANYISASRFETVSSTLTIDVSLISLTSGIATQKTFVAADGGTLNIGSETSLTLPPNSTFKDASGNPFTDSVTVNMAYVDPTSDNSNRLLEGSSQMLDDAGNQLESFGVLRVEIMDNAGNPITFEGDSLTKSAANVGVAIAPTKLTTSPQTVTLYSYNTQKSAYVSSGATASKVGGQYVGTVSHFSSWNCAIKPATAQEGTMQYTLNGGQFQNQPFSNFTTKQAYWDIDSISGNGTRITCNGTDGIVSIYLKTINTTGTYNFDGTNNIGYINPQNQVQLQFQSGSYVTISKFEQVGGLIEGTFTATCSLDTVPYSVNNGSFSITRGADQ